MGLSKEFTYSQVQLYLQYAWADFKGLFVVLNVQIIEAIKRDLHSLVV